VRDLMKYALVVDSCCELTEEMKNQKELVSVPLKFTIDGKEYIDDSSLDMAEFLEALKNTKEVPKSSCPAPGEFLGAFMNLDAEYIFVLPFSVKLSGSHNSAVQAAEMAREQGKNIHVFNSKNASASLLLISKEILRLMNTDLTPEEIIEETEKFIEDTRIFLMLEKTDTLIKTGRMNPLVGKALAMLNIRLIIKSDGEGAIMLSDKVRGSQKATIDKLAQNIADLSTEKSDTLIITHCSNEEGAKYLAEKASSLHGFKKVEILPANAIIGLYTDIGGLVAGFNK